MECSIKKIFIFFLALFLFVIDISALAKAPVDITKMSISDLRIYIDKGYLTSETLVNLYLDRINNYNKNYNAIRFINKNALNEAKELDKKLQKGEKLSELHGIPIVVKTNIDVKGIATTAGARALSDNMPNEDADVVAKLKEAGAIILASTNMSEFAFSAGYSNSSYGNVHNAYNNEYTSYGSSGGSAVAVALSFAAAALGTDTNSSVRVPASAAYLVGMRPTIGLVNNDGVIPYDITRDTVGVMTKTVSDNSLILDIIKKDTDHFDMDEKKDLKGVKIGIINEFLKGKDNSSLKANSKTNDEIYNMMLDAIKKLENLGAEMVYIDDFFTNYYYGLWNGSVGGFTFCDGFNKYIENTTGSIRSFQELANASGRIMDISGYAYSCGTSSSKLNIVYEKREKYIKHVDDVFDQKEIDMIVYPTTKNKLNKISSGAKVTAPSSFVSSVTGYPAVTIPLGFDSNNLPYGIEFLALANEEEKLYEVTSLFDKNRNLEGIKSAPSLYEIPESVTKLMQIYDNNKYWETGLIKDNNEKALLKIKKQIKDFFINYSEAENVDEESTNYIEKLNEIKPINKSNNINILNILIYIGLLISFGLVFRKKKVVKKRKI